MSSLDCLQRMKVAFKFLARGADNSIEVENVSLKIAVKADIRCMPDVNKVETAC